MRLERLLLCIGCRIAEGLSLLLDMFSLWMEQPLKIDSGRAIPQELDRPCTGGIGVGGCSRSKLVEMVDLKARESISNVVICASYMSNNYMCAAQ